MEENNNPTPPQKPETDFHNRIHGTNFNSPRIDRIRGSIDKGDSTIKDESVSPPPPPVKKK